jgi:hypothetical protein
MSPPRRELKGRLIVAAAPKTESIAVEDDRCVLSQMGGRSQRLKFRKGLARLDRLQPIGFSYGPIELRARLAVNSIHLCERADAAKKSGFPIFA